jgi:hypothetical protein
VARFFFYGVGLYVFVIGLNVGSVLIR